MIPVERWLDPQDYCTWIRPEDVEGLEGMEKL